WPRIHRRRLLQPFLQAADRRAAAAVPPLDGAGRAPPALGGGAGLTVPRPPARPQPGLFGADPALPEGLRYAPDLITAAEESGLAARLAALDFRAFEFHGHLGKRRVLSFGWRYDFKDVGFYKTDEIPDFLHPLRVRAAAFAGLAPLALEHVLLTE